MILPMPEERLRKYKVDMLGKVNAKKLYDETRTRQMLVDLCKWATANSPANAVKFFQFVNQSAIKIYVVGMSGGNPGFNDDYAGDKETLHVIFLDLDGNFAATKGDGAAITAGPVKQRRPWGNFDATADVMGVPVNLYHSVPNEIVAFHEIGHAKQFIENPAAFVDDAHRPLNSILPHIEARAKEFTLRRMGATDSKEFRATLEQAELDASIARGSKREYQKPAWLAEAETKNAAVGLKYRNDYEKDKDGTLSEKFVPERRWHALLEMDNIARHEMPVCIEAFGSIVRNNYRAFTSVKMLPPGYKSLPPHSRGLK